MTHSDAHLDAVLRHLGAAYYESLHGRAARSDVARALDTVEEQLGEQGQAHAARKPGPGYRDDGLRKRRWARRVSACGLEPVPAARAIALPGAS